MLLFLGLLVFVASWEPTLEKFKWIRYIALASQCDDDFITSDFSCYWCNFLKEMGHTYTHVYHIDETKYNHYFFSAVENGNHLFVSFRGTVLMDRDPGAAITNWLQNFQMGLRKVSFQDDPDVKAHKGFMDGYDELDVLVLTRINEILDTVDGITKVSIIGSSLGGALSTLCALDLLTNANVHPKLRTIYDAGNFLITSNGCPRLGNDEFVKWSNSVLDPEYHVRATNQKDAVVRTPMKIQGYRHLPYEYYFSSDTSFKKCDGSGEDGSCANKHLISTSVEDHMNYFGIHVKDGYGPTC